MALGDIKQLLRINTNEQDTLIQKVWDDTYNSTLWLDDFESDPNIRHRLRVYIASLNVVRLIGTFPPSLERGLEKIITSMMSKYIVSD